MPNTLSIIIWPDMLGFWTLFWIQQSSQCFNPWFLIWIPIAKVFWAPFNMSETAVWLLSLWREKMGGLLVILVKILVQWCRSGSWFLAVFIQVFFFTFMWFCPRSNKARQLVGLAWVFGASSDCLMVMPWGDAECSGLERPQRRGALMSVVVVDADTSEE